jgi:preprotein translocase subunit SecD
MPGIQDPERVKQLLKADSNLELVHVVSPPSPAPAQTYNTKEEAEASLGGKVPANRRVFAYAERNEPTTASQAADTTPKDKKWVVVEWPSVVDGSELRNASATQTRGGAEDYQISFAFKPTGAEKFGTWTGANINQYMGVVLNDEVKSIAYIKSQIFDQGEITGRFTKQSAEDIAGEDRIPGRTHGRSESRCGFDSCGCSRFGFWSAIRRGVHALLLQRGGHQRCSGTPAQHDPDVGGSDRF